MRDISRMIDSMDRFLDTVNTPHFRALYTNYQTFRDMVDTTLHTYQEGMCVTRAVFGESGLSSYELALGEKANRIARLRATFLM